MTKQRISYVPLEKMDAEMRREMERCQREGTPRPESSAVRAHVSECFWAFANSWRDIFKNSVEVHINRAAPRIYTVYGTRDNAALEAPAQAQLPGVPPAIADTTSDWHAIEALSAETPPSKKH